jgi:hypothetical protein
MRAIGEWLNPIISSGEFIFIAVVVLLILASAGFAWMWNESSRVYPR